MKNNRNQKFTPISPKGDDEVVESESSNLSGDYQNVALLLLLYLLQGVPQGISLAIPILLQNRGATYSEQAQFSISYFPFGLKLLWAPVIDSIFIKSFGRRKTWICSSQIVIGSFMIYLSYNADKWLGDGDTMKPQIGILTAVFFTLWLLTSVQDIAVDGWGLTLLKRRNIGYAATTNSCGQSAGKFIGFILLLVFESKEFCNSYIFSEPKDIGLFTLSGFIMFWACVYMIVTILLALFKYECPENAEQLKEHSDYGICKAYQILYKIIKLKPVVELYTMIFSIEACFAAFEAITSLKLIEYGVPKEKFALISVPSAPIQILFPLLITKYTAGRKPLSFYYKVFICRLTLMIITTFYVASTPMILENENFLNYFYAGVVMLFMIDQAAIRATYTSDGSFFSKIADPLVGGSYMTLLNTFGNLGKRTFVTLSLWLMDRITWRKCDIKNISNDETLSFTHLANNTCLDSFQKITCKEIGGTCKTEVDGYYVEIGFSVVYGLIWFTVFRSVIYRLQRYSREDWYVLTNNKSSRNVEMT
ncbi:hypothetical protein ACKWTF_008619 [Chironomus riparius]